MRILTLWLLIFTGLLLAWPAEAYRIGPDTDHSPHQGNQPQGINQVHYREECNTAQAQVDQGIDRYATNLTGVYTKVNNVRARLTQGGDVWWDRADGKYIVPHPDPGGKEVASLFAGGVWLGGVDPAGNLKTACQTYGNRTGQSDFWAGPLDLLGNTDLDVCNNWDRFFEVYAQEIDIHRNLYAQSLAGGTYDPADIPTGVKGWPARGNPFFFEINEFELPNTDQGLAGFWDENGDDLYNPLDGDYPIIEIRGCTEPQYPDQMIFWIYNDNGANVHGESMGLAIKMEVQVQAFAYGTNDQLNDMTFQRYKLINRATEDIDSTYFAMWVDADLGCFLDDYIGCDTSRSLAYTYNADAADGDNGTDCTGGVPTYGNEIPIIGTDYFRGPLKILIDTINGEVVRDTIELGMSSFTYYNNGGFNNPPLGTRDPETPEEFYNYLTGHWKDGSPFQYGGDAYQEAAGEEIDYAFTEPPNDADGWSMCTESLQEFDRRTIQASGPFLLRPGEINELIIGVPWVPDLNYPCPDISRLFAADDLAQSLFDNCFDITDGPDAPDMDFIELDRKIIAVLSNDTLLLNSNNAYEQYSEIDLLSPTFLPEEQRSYKFEGYIVYQLAGPEVTKGDYDNQEKARIIQMYDKKNGISKFYEWKAVQGPGDSIVIYYPELVLETNETGIRHTFEIDADQFAEGDKRLINHKKYYFSVVAFAYNNWQDFDPATAIGQKQQLLIGRRNIKTYTVIPRPIVDRKLNAAYGDGPVITRVDGLGVGGNFLDLSDETRDLILENKLEGEITYKAGRGPIAVSVYNPLELVGGDYELRFVDGNNADSELDSTAFWELRSLSDPSQGVIRSERSIYDLNEQVLQQYGFTVSIEQQADVGSQADETNGAIGYEEEYADLDAPVWLAGVPDDFGNLPALNYVPTAFGEPHYTYDPSKSLSQIGPGYFVPFQLCDYRSRGAGEEYITPGWRNTNGGLVVDPGNLLKNLNNVDIVFTSDKSKWSRCIIVETANNYYSDLGLVTDGNAKQFDLRPQPAVGKDDNDGDGLPDPDGSGRMGMGWFPGYAIDVETGQRLNIFFGENTAYDCSIFCESYDDQKTNTLDMMFNPSSQFFLETGQQTSVFNFFGGGQHFIYVLNTPYDGCEDLYTKFSSPNQFAKVGAMQSITWAGWPMLLPGTKMKSYAEGLIPNDLIVKLRVNDPYQIAVGTGEFNGYPTYRFSFAGAEPSELDEAGVESALDMINVVPNPYYGFSSYENSQFDNIVKITNLPAKCTVTIYSLDGKFVRRYDRDETGLMPDGNNRGVRQAQINPDISWDLKNYKGIPVAGGVYLIHIQAEGLGERVIKWFGTNRQFDPAGL